ncbi:uncharacterized protein LAJ45_03669 [Morchella importuna]|uniref:uncharacterized protein n=1 Tax=Morchella importuna TaxID=1174673 RepID=UPI001E8CAF32|nr:uncharacterized protein LAJ45_03669 [Morchella importuna]KAH8152243.1 hypothetical protein LAJ45_03669 [Morchella importuna]
MFSVNHDAACDVTAGVKVAGHSNPLTPHRRPFRCLTPVGANASPTLSEGFIRDYLSPGTVYVPRSRSQTPSSGTNSPTFREHAQRALQIDEDEASRALGDPRQLSRWLTQVEVDAPPTLSDGFIRDYISPGTTYVPGLRHSKTPATREHSPVWTPESVEGNWSLDLGVSCTPDRALPLPSAWSTSVEGETSPTWRLRWVNDFVPHTTHTVGPQRQTSNATRTPEGIKDECPNEQSFLSQSAPSSYVLPYLTVMYIDTNSDDVAPGPRTPDRHVRSRWLTPAEGDTSPTLREWFPDNNPVQISSGRSLHDSEDHFPGAASSGFNRELTADQEILLSEAPRVQRYFSDWLVETQGDVLPTLRDDPVSIRDDDHPGAISLSLSQGPTTVAESSESKALQCCPEGCFSDLLAGGEAYVSPTLTDDSMSMRDDDRLTSVEPCTFEEQKNVQEAPESSQDGPSVESTSEAFRDSARMDLDIPHACEPEERKRSRMTDEELFRFEAPGPGSWMAPRPAQLSAVSTGSITNNHTTIIHHHCDSVDTAELSPSITRGRRNSRAGSSDFKPRIQGHLTGADMRSHNKDARSSAAKAIKGEPRSPTWKFIKEEPRSSPVLANRVQTLIHHTAHQPADYTPTPHWFSHISSTDILIQRGAAVVSRTESSPTRTRRSKGTANRSRPFNRVRDRRVDTIRLDSTALEAARPSCAITTRRWMVTSPTKRRQVAGPGHNAHSASGASKADDSPEDDDEDRLEYDLERNENNLHDAKH